MSQANSLSVSIDNSCTVDIAISTAKQTVGIFVHKLLHAADGNRLRFQTARNQISLTVG